MSDVWYEDPETVHSVATWAVDEGWLRGVDNVLYFFEKPWKHGELYAGYAKWAHESDKADR